VKSTRIIVVDIYWAVDLSQHALQETALRVSIYGKSVILGVFQ